MHEKHTAQHMDPWFLWAHHNRNGWKADHILDNGWQHFRCSSMAIGHKHAAIQKTLTMVSNARNYLPWVRERYITLVTGARSIASQSALSVEVWPLKIKSEAEFPSEEKNCTFKWVAKCTRFEYLGNVGTEIHDDSLDATWPTKCDNKRNACENVMRQLRH